MKTELRFDHRFGVAIPEIRDVTFGLWGSELPEHAAIQRLVRAGFPVWVPSHLDVESPHSPLLEMFAIIEGESGSYVKAWHANVLRDPPFTGQIVLDEMGMMTIKSIDLGFIQLNVNVVPDATVTPNEPTMAAYVQSQFDHHPELARADLSAMIAHDLWLERGFKPWFAYKPGTDNYRQKKARGAKAIGNWLARSFVGRIDPLTGAPSDRYPRLEYTNAG